MKIGLIIYGSLDTLTGGYLYDKKVVEHLESCGHEVTILSQVQRSYLGNISDNWRNDIFDRIVEKKYDLLLEDELNHPSLFHLNHRLKQRTAIPIVSIVHVLRTNAPLNFISLKFTEMLERKFLRTLDGYIAVSSHTQYQVEQLLDTSTPSTIAHPAGDRFQTEITEEDVANKCGEANVLQVLFVGSVSPRKNLLDILKAMASLEDASVRLSVVGPMPNESYAQKIRRYIGNHGLESRVQFYGVITDTEALAGHYRQAHLLILPSFSEGFPLVHVEAAGFGVPSIATSHSGASDFVEHGVNGYIVDPGDVKAIRAHLARLQADKNILHSLSSAALGRFRRHPTWEETGDKICEFLENLLNRESRK